MSPITSEIRVPFVDLRSEYRLIRSEIEAMMARVFEQAAFVQGPQVAEFEEAFARFCGARHAVGVANGTDALLLALKAAQVGPGQEVIIPAHTFVATAEAVVHSGAIPVLVDVDPLTYTIDADQVEARITPRTRAIVAVHLYGQPAEMRRLRQVAGAGNLILIEDAAQAHGAAEEGQRTGTLGNVACFSFYPSKNLGAYGDAGAIVTNDDDVAAAVRRLRDHGAIGKYEHDVVGYNSRLDTLQAAVLSVKLRHLERWNALRQAHARAYSTALAGEPLITPPAVRSGVDHVFHLYVIAMGSGHRDALRGYLRGRGIETGIHYPVPVHLTRAFRWLNHRDGAFPVAERLAAEILSLPMFPGLGEEQLAYVADSVRQFAREHPGGTV